MDPDVLTLIALVGMAAISAAGIVWVFVVPSSDRRAARRKAHQDRARDTGPRKVGGVEVAAEARRRRQTQAARGNAQEHRREAEAGQPAVAVQADRTRRPELERAQLRHLLGGVAACVFALFGVIMFAPLMALPVLLFIRRVSAFRAGFSAFSPSAGRTSSSTSFPNAVDIIVRGIKAGLPLNDCLRMIASEAEEPVRSEFKIIVEAQTMGLSIADAVERIYERMPLPRGELLRHRDRHPAALEAAIWRKALSNLSKVLARSQEAQGQDRGAQPGGQGLGRDHWLAACRRRAGRVHHQRPDYISLLWTEPLGQIMIGGCAVWMLMGILIMRTMINFKI